MAQKLSGRARQKVVRGLVVVGMVPLVVVLGLEPAALEVMLRAEPGRAKGTGEAAPWAWDEAPAPVELGCWRTAKTKVLLRARRWHWGWTT